MPINGLILPKLFAENGVAAWQLPPAEIRQMDEHSHSEAQLCGLSAGLAIVETKAGSWLCPPGRCVWIPSGTPHSLRSCGKVSGWALHLKAEMSHDLHREPKVLALTGLLREVVKRITEWVADPAPDAAKTHLVLVLKDEIARASQVELHLPAPRDPALQRFAMRLSEAPESLGNIAALAYEAGISERSLFRGFQRETGMSPGRWRRHMQILRSLEWLADGKSVTEASLQAGYESVGAFIRAFRQVLGITPSIYAKQSGEGTRLGDDVL